MQPIHPKNLIEGNIYLIEYHGPDGIIGKYKGVYNKDSENLNRFDKVIKYNNGNEIPIIWFHTPSDTNHHNLYYWLFFMPTDIELKRRVFLHDAKIEISKTLLLQKTFKQLSGDPSTVKGLIQKHCYC
jgi:hypothetical protein